MMITMCEKGLKIWDVEFGEIRWQLELNDRYFFIYFLRFFFFFLARICDFCILEGLKKQDKLLIFTENEGSYKFYIID